MLGLPQFDLDNGGTLVRVVGAYMGVFVDTIIAMTMLMGYAQGYARVHASCSN